MLMFGAKTIGTARACVASSARCAGASPVVPATSATRRRAHAAAWARVPSGRVKSISTSATASAPSTSLRHRHARAVPDALARVLADAGTARDVERRGQREVGCGEHRLHQRLPHAPAGAGHRDAQAHQLPFRMSSSRPK